AGTRAPPRGYCRPWPSCCLPDLAEARDLIGDPDEIANIVAHRGELQREEQRDVGQIARHVALRLPVEPGPDILVGQPARLIKQAIDLRVDIAAGVCRG